MKISFCVLKNLCYGGGIEKYTLELGECLAKRGHDVTVYTMRHYGPIENPVHGMHVISVPCLHGATTEKFSAAGIAAIRTLFDPKADIIHFQHISSGWAAPIPKLRKQKCILQVHGIGWKGSKWSGFGSRFLQVLEKKAIKHCDALTSVSKNHIQYYRKHYGVNAIHIPCGVSKSKKTKPVKMLSLGLNHNSYILFVGRLSKEKGLHYLINAFKQLNTDLKLVIAGGECYEKYTKYLYTLSTDNPRIVFLGEVHAPLLSELYSNAFIYVQPSEVEGLSIALLEAMSYGICCLVSDIPENLEAIGNTGLTFSTANTNSLHEQLKWLLDHPDVIYAKGCDAKEHIEKHYSWDHVTNQMEALYENVLNDTPYICSARTNLLHR